MSLSDKFYMVIGIFILIGLVGWVSNIVWICHQTTLGNVALGVIGAFLAPIGAIHGLWVLI